MSDGMTVDLTQFNAALREYEAVSSKDSAEAINHAALNLAIKGVQATKVAEAAAIRKLKDMDWWPKYVAKVMAKLAGGKAASKLYQSVWAAEEMRNHRKGAWKLDREETSYVRFAKKLSSELLAKRTKAVKFMRFFFLSMAWKIRPYSGGATAPGGQVFDGMAADVKPATAGNLNVEMKAGYDYRKRSDKTARKAERLLNGWLQKAVPAATADMRGYIERKLAQRSRQFSAGRAA